MISRVLIGTGWFYVYGEPDQLRSLAIQLNLKLDAIEHSKPSTDIFKIWNIDELTDIYAESRPYVTYNGEIIDEET